MHTMTMRLKDGTEICVHHNSDWSGDVVVKWGKSMPLSQVTIPAKVMLAVCAKAAYKRVKAMMISAIESIGPEEQ